MLPEDDGSIGEISVTNDAGVVILNQAGSTTQLTSSFTTPTPPVILTPAEIQVQFGVALNVLPTLGITPSQNSNGGSGNGNDNSDGDAVPAIAPIDVEAPTEPADDVEADDALQKNLETDMLNGEQIQGPNTIEEANGVTEIEAINSTVPPGNGGDLRTIGINEGQSMQTALNSTDLAANSQMATVNELLRSGSARLVENEDGTSALVGLSADGNVLSVRVANSLSLVNGSQFAFMNAEPLGLEQLALSLQNYADLGQETSFETASDTSFIVEISNVEATPTVPSLCSSLTGDSQFLTTSESNSLLLAASSNLSSTIDLSILSSTNLISTSTTSSTSLLTTSNSSSLSTLNVLETVTGGATDDTVTRGETVNPGFINLGAGNDTLNLADDKNVVLVSNTETINGGGENDTISVFTTSAAMKITGGGNDTLTLSSLNQYTVVFSNFADNGTDIISGFNTGAGGDILDVGGLGLSGTTSVQLFATDSASQSATNVALIDDAVFSGVNSSDDFLSQLFTFLGAISSGTLDTLVGSFSGGDNVLFVIDDATAANDVSLWHWADDGDATVEAAEITDVSTLDNTDISTLSATNFA